MASPVPGIAEFALRLEDETGCVLADANRCTIVDRGFLLPSRSRGVGRVPSRTSRSPADRAGGNPASDFAVFELLRKHSDLPACHALHYLQMATEMLGKAKACKYGRSWWKLPRDISSSS
ncbi:MAG: hypothetical protein ACLQVF_43755 [Isosphaeraceae bacterium]